jgi:hypothetical protein
LPCPLKDSTIVPVMEQIYAIKVKATTLHYDYVSAMNDFMTDIATDGDEHSSWADHAYEMDLLRQAVNGKARIDELERFFKDGNTMMALGASCMHEIDNYFHKQKGKADDLVLIITDEAGKTLYTISGQHLNY